MSTRGEMSECKGHSAPHEKERGIAQGHLDSTYSGRRLASLRRVAVSIFFLFSGTELSPSSPSP